MQDPYEQRVHQVDAIVRSHMPTPEPVPEQVPPPSIPPLANRATRRACKHERVKGGYCWDCGQPR